MCAHRFWHKDVHEELCQDKTGRNLLYLEVCVCVCMRACVYVCSIAVPLSPSAQGVHAIEKGQWKCREEEKKAINKAHQKNQKKEVRAT